MTARIYVRQGGGTATEVEFSDLGGRKGSPFLDANTPLVQMGQRFADGEAATGYFKIIDPDAELPYPLNVWTPGFRLPPHAEVRLTEDASGSERTLAWMRIAPYETGRRATYIGGDEIEHDVTLLDCNTDLRGIPFRTTWSRPAETHIQRLNALEAAKLDGASSTNAVKRVTTDILVDTGHLVDGSAPVDLDAKDYPPGTEVSEVLADIAEQADQLWGVVLHHGTGGGSGTHKCLMMIDADDHTTWFSGVRISDDPADWDPDSLTTPTFEPHWLQGKGRIVDNDFVLSGLVNIWGGTDEDPRSVYVETADDDDDWETWVGVNRDDESETENQATRVAEHYLRARKRPDVTHRISILMKAEQVHLISAGMSLDVKSVVANSGAGKDAFTERRIAELKFEPAADGLWWAHMNLERARRSRPPGRGGAQPGATSPKPPPETVPDTPGTAIVTWDFEGGGSGTTMDTTDTWDSNLGLEDESDKCPNGAAWCGYITASHKSTDFITGLTPDTDYVLSGDVLWRTNPAIRDIGVGWNGGGHMDQILVDGSSGYAEDTTYSFSKTFHLPVGFDRVQVVFSPYGGFSVDNLVLSTVATAAENDEHSVDYGDCPHDSPYYLPSDYVECRLDNLQDQIDGRRVVSDVDPTPSDDELAGYPTGTLWVNQTTDMAWISVDGSEGVAVWERIDNEEPTSGRNTPLTGALSAVPTQTELDTLIGDTPDNLPGEQYIATANDTGRVWQVYSDGLQWVGRQLIVFPGSAGGGGGPEPGGGADAADTLKTLADSPAGGWQMIRKPIAVAANGETAWTFINGTTGSLYVRARDHATGTTSSAALLTASYEDDNHANPAMLRRASDGVVIFLHSKHNDPALRQRLTNSGGSSLTAAIASGLTTSNLDSQLGGTAYTYPTLYEMADELFLGVRPVAGGTGQTWAMSRSTDGINSGTTPTWSGLTTILSVPGRRPYPMLIRTSSTRVDMLVADGHVTDGETDISIWHAYYDSSTNTWHATDGTPITLPCTTANMTLVYDGTGGWTRAQDVVLGADGHPRVLFTWESGNPGGDIRYMTARWTGAAWTSAVEIAADATYTAAGNTTSGGSCFDYADQGATVFCSREVSGVMEMFRYTTADNGATWSGTAITTGSSEDQFFPHCPIDQDTALSVLWQSGYQNSFTDWLSGTRGY